MGTFTPSLRLSQPTPGDPVVKNQWGTILNTNDSLIEAGVTGIASINMAGITTYTLTTANGAADQARNAVYEFTGQPGALSTVTLPTVPKVGWAWNNQTSHDLVLTTGSGATLRVTLPNLNGVPPGGQMMPFVCDGTNVVSPGLTCSNLVVGSPSGYGTYAIFCLDGQNSNAHGLIVDDGSGGVQYNTLSDYRLKENVAPLENQLARVMNLRPVRYTHK